MQGNLSTSHSWPFPLKSSEPTMTRALPHPLCNHVVLVLRQVVALLAEAHVRAAGLRPGVGLKHDDAGPRGLRHGTARGAAAGVRHKHPGAQAHGCVQVQGSLRVFAQQ